MRCRRTVALAATLVALPGLLAAQQFNSDNYLTMPHGTGTFVLTTGTEYSTIMSSFALFRRWEFFAGAFLAWEDASRGATASWSSTVYAKYMPYENKAKNGGLGIAAGTGNLPGHFEQDSTTASFRTYWILPEGTLPLLSGKVLWDLNPGVVLNTSYGDGSEIAWGFLYSTRVAVYGIVPSSALVGEVFGTAGGAHAQPQYRVGVRWEPSDTFVGALTWSHGFESARSGGAEIGILIFTPRFLCSGGCGSD